MSNMTYFFVIQTHSLDFFCFISLLLGSGRLIICGWEKRISTRNNSRTMALKLCSTSQFLFFTRLRCFVSFQPLLSGFWLRGSLAIMKQTQVSFCLSGCFFHCWSWTLTHTNYWFILSSIHPFTHPNGFLSLSAGALYSRKVTLDGEEVSLQIQDTPCVALQVAHGNRDISRVKSRLQRSKKLWQRVCFWHYLPLSFFYCSEATNVGVSEVVRRHQ